MKSTGKPSIARSHGFTLPEVLIATFVSVILITGLLATVVQLRSAMRAQELLGEMHQNTRFAMAAISRDVRMAGYGLDIPPMVLDDWVTWITNYDENPKIEEGTSGAPDELTVVAAFGDPVAILSTPALVGDTSLNLTAVGGFDMNDGLDIYKHRLLFIGKSTTARITSKTASGVTISIHPDREMGLKYDYPAGTVVERVQTFRHLLNDPEKYHQFPHILREDISKTYDDARTLPITAGYIEDIQVTELADAWEVSLAGIVSQPDRFYTHPTEGDHFRRETLTSVISKRN